jgi:hypothetical protein
MSPRGRRSCCRRPERAVRRRVVDARVVYAEEGVLVVDAPRWSWQWSAACGIYMNARRRRIVADPNLPGGGEEEMRGGGGRTRDTR